MGFEHEILSLRRQLEILHRDLSMVSSKLNLAIKKNAELRDICAKMNYSNMLNECKIIALMDVFSREIEIDQGTIDKYYHARQESHPGLQEINQAIDKAKKKVSPVRNIVTDTFAKTKPPKNPNNN